MMGYFGYSQRSFRDSRTRYTSTDIVKVWAFQQDTSGRCSSNMSFYGVEFSSYSTVVATIITYNERKAYLLTDEHHSSTTAGHMSDIRRAIPEGQKIFTGPIYSDPMRVLASWRDSAKRRLADLEDAPNADYLTQARAIIAKMTEFAAYFGIPIKPFLVAVPDAEKYLLQWRKDAKKILAHMRKEPRELHTAFTIEAYRIYLKMRSLARGAGIPIEGYKVNLPMKEPDIKAAILAHEQAKQVRQRLGHANPSPETSMFNSLLAACIPSSSSRQPHPR